MNNENDIVTFQCYKGQAVLNKPAKFTISRKEAESFAAVGVGIILKNGNPTEELKGELATGDNVHIPDSAIVGGKKSRKKSSKRGK